MLRRFFCKLLVIAVVVFGLLAFSGVLFAQGNSNNGLARAIEVQERNTNRLMAVNGVVGTAVGLNPSGRFAVAVLLERPGIGGIPQQLEGIPIHSIVTGKIYAVPKPNNPGHGHGGGGGGGDGGGGSLSPTDTWPRPVPIGVSTGNAGECSSGTISCRVKSGNTVYALSNNHVYALENDAQEGSEVLQPGLYDTQCVYDPDNHLGTLFAYVPIDFSTSANNVVDAAIASTSVSNLGNSTPSDGYGIPISTDGTNALTAELNQPVMKYGRTTSLTEGYVVGINATVNVGYSNGTARFVNQIWVHSNKGAFIKPGDSGSLLVTDPGREPVGLLFAGDNSGKYAIANPIGDVLDIFGVSIDGE